MLRLILTYASSNGLSRALVFLVVPLLSNFLKADDLGIYTLTQTVSQLIVPLITFNTGVALTREMIDNPRTVGQLFWRITFFAVGMIALGTILLQLSFSWIAVAVIIGSAEAIQSAAVAIFQGKEKAGKVFGVALFRNLMFAAMVIAAYLHKFNLQFLLLVQASVYCFSAVFAVFLARTLIRRSLVDAPQVEKIGVKAMFLYSIVTLPHTASLWLSASSDRLLLGAIRGSDVLGEYAIAFTFGQVALLVTSGVAMALPPRVARDPEIWTNPVFLRRFTLLTGAACLAAHLFALVVIYVDRLTIHQFSKMTSDGIYIIAIISTAAFSSTMYVLYASFLFLHRETSKLPKAATLAGLTNLISTSVMVYSFGAVGAAAGLLITYLSFGFFYSRAAAAVHPQSRGTFPFLCSGVVVYLLVALSFSHLMSML
jgi:O-antigen/teichoic acid export membrane protein